MPLASTLSLSLSNSMATSSRPLGTWRILWESLKLPTKNLTLMLPILILSLLTYSILFLANYYSTTPLIAELTITAYSISTATPDKLQTLLAIIRKDIVELAIYESIFIPISFIISSFILTTIVQAISSIHLKEHITLRELFTRVNRSWKGLIITQLLETFFNLGCVFLFMVLIFFFSGLAFTGISAGLVVTGVVVALLVLFLYLGVVVVLTLGEMVSVLEDGCYGFSAMARAMALFKEKKRQGMVIFFVVMLISGAISGGISFITAVHPLISGILMANLVRVWAVVVLSVYTLFYYECKKSLGEEMVLGKEGFLYQSVPNEGDLAVSIA